MKQVPPSAGRARAGRRRGVAPVAAVLVVVLGLVGCGGSETSDPESGQRAAIAMDRYLGGSGVLPPDVSMSLFRATDDELEAATEQLAEPLIPLGERLGFEEVVGTFHPEGACAEASRCLRCDLEWLQIRDLPEEPQPDRVAAH